MVAAALLTASCGRLEEDEEESIEETVAGKVAADAPVTFADPSLETAIRDALNKRTDPMTPSDLKSLTSLSAPKSDIGDLSGLEYCVELNVRASWRQTTF
ncbi:hypothetical protein ACFLVQ_00740 [Chloroflexota bacterium]